GDGAGGRTRELGFRERQRSSLLFGGVEDPRVRGRGTARVASAGAGRRADRVGFTTDQGRQEFRGTGATRPGGTTPVQTVRRPSQWLRTGLAGIPRGAGRGTTREAGHHCPVIGDRQPGGRSLRARLGAAYRWFYRRCQ